MSRVLATSVLATVASLALVAASAPAHAAQTKRVIDDPVEPGNAYDIVKVVMKSQKTTSGQAKVTVTHGRQVQVGDTIDVWFNLDQDAQPEIHLVGDSFSEYTVFQTTSFTEDGKDISKRGCMSLQMVRAKSKVKFDPKCLKAGPTFAVSVKSSRTDQPAETADYVPAPEKFTKRVVSGPLA